MAPAPTNGDAANSKLKKKKKVGECLFQQKILAPDTALFEDRATEMQKLDNGIISR